MMNHDDLIWCKESILRVLAIASLCTNTELDCLIEMLYKNYVEANESEDAKAIYLMAQAIQIYKEVDDGGSKS